MFARTKCLDYFFAPAASSLRITPLLSSDSDDFAIERAVKPSRRLRIDVCALVEEELNEVVASVGRRDHQGRARP